jgi:hypothetical protein
MAFVEKTIPMKLFIILNLFVFYSMHLEARVECLHTAKKDALSWVNENERAFLVADFDFRSSSFVPAFLGCLRFLEETKNTEQNFFTLFTMKDLPTVRIEYPTRSPYYQSCLESEVCHVVFPYNLLNVWKYGPNILKKSVNKKDWSSKCSEHQVDLNSNNRLTHAQATIPSEIWELPNTSLAKKFFEKLETASEGTVVISTMTVSEKLVHKLRKIAEIKPKLKILMVFSFNLVSMRKEFSKIMNHQRENFILLPMFTDPANNQDYHIKGASIVSNSVNDYYFQSGNFREYDATTMTDLGFTITGAGKEFENNIHEVIMQKCQKRSYAQCSFETRYGHKLNLLNKINNSWDKICNTTPLSSKLVSSERILISSKFNLQRAVYNLIDTAKIEIKLMAHLIFDPNILHKLQIAKDRGVKIQVLQGQPNRLIEKSLNFVKFSQEERESHTKLIIIDHKSAIVSSANWTPNGFENPMEISFVINDSASLNKLSDHFDRNWSIGAY